MGYGRFDCKCTTLSSYCFVLQNGKNLFLGEGERRYGYSFYTVTQQRTQPDKVIDWDCPSKTIFTIDVIDRHKRNPLLVWEVETQIW